MLPSNWTASATRGEIELTPSSPIQNLITNWNATGESNKIILKLDQNTNGPLKLVIATNSTYVTYSYKMLINDTTYSGTIVPDTGNEENRYFKWTDSKEKAASAFIPENWSADMQIVRPYKSMTGFVFFARGTNHTLVYVFQPFMPLHLLPDAFLCKSVQLCPGLIPTDKVRALSFGNAPVTISQNKTPEQYFTSEVLPVLRKNLRSYAVESTVPTFALTMGENSTDLSLMPAYDVKYSFDSEGKLVDGKAMVFTRNYTSDNQGIWNGFIVGVESLDKNFDSTFQQATVTLMTLRFDGRWLDTERKALIDSGSASRELENVSALMANNTLNDFNIITPTAGYKMVRSYNDTMIAGFVDNATKENLYLPLFPNSQHWYLDNDQLVGRKAGRNPLKTNSLEALFS